MDNDLDLDLPGIALILAALGAINWGAMEVLEQNLVVEVVGSSNAGLVYVVVGVAGLAVLADWTGAVDLDEV